MKLVRRLLTVGVFFAGFFCYPRMEIWYRGTTHPSMALAGGVCAAAVYGINCALRRSCLIVRAGVSGFCITGIEFVFGVVCNLWLKWNVWSYSAFRFSLWGQICPTYCLLWCLLSVPLSLCFGMVARCLGARVG